MGWIRRYRLVFARIVGVLCILAGAFLALAWYAWATPLIRRADPCWVDGFSRKAFWDTAQSDIRQYGWLHDDFALVGRCGDETWAKWILSTARENEDLDSCYSGHKHSALRYLTGQEPERLKNETCLQAWRRWWEKNRDKSQAEWIKDGLAQHGLAVRIPPSAEDRLSLLALLGKAGAEAAGRNSDQESPAEEVPDYVRYNAFRWLRDSDFNPVDYAMTNVSKSTPPLVRQGLLVYFEDLQQWPSEDGLGILRLLPRKPDSEASRPRFCLPQSQIAGHAIMSFLVAFGVILLLVTRPRRNAGGKP